ncbi:hypothetical protein ACFL0D_08900 [Thermoproteota archaeon]
MGRKNKKPSVRINFLLKGELAEWLQEMKKRGFITSNPEAVRFALPLLRDYYNKIWASLEHKKNVASK